MRRWNGWGEDSDEYALGDDARAFLAARVGPGQAPHDASLEQVLDGFPPSRIPVAAIPLDTDARARLLHARGQSFPDWLALRSGRVGPCADGVALPTSHDEAAQALAAARKLGAVVIPYGGGTSVVGHLSVPATDRPVVNISLERMNRLLGVDDPRPLVPGHPDHRSRRSCAHRDSCSDTFRSRILIRPSAAGS